jgi:polysaccharide chain length determinant protein (PEP-CTERM system associated)
MNDVLGQLQVYAAALWRKRWYIVPVAWVLCVAGWLTVMSLPDKFVSSARIYVDTDSLLSPLLRGISVEGNVAQQVDYMQRTLLSRPNLEKLMRMADLDLTVKTPKEKDDLLEDMSKRTTIQAQGQGKNLFTVSFTDNKPEVAQRVVQSLLSIFVESNIGASRTDLEKARQFLDQQIADYERQLQSAEAKLANFKRQNLDYTGAGAAAGYSARLEALRQQRVETKNALDDAIGRRDSLQKDLTATPQQLEVAAPPTPNFYIQPNGVPAMAPSLQAIQTRIDEHQKALDQMRMRYTEQHPDVVSTKRSLDALQKQFDEEKARLEGTEKDVAAPAKPARKGAQPAAQAERKTSVPNPLYDQIKIKLVEMSSTVETLQRKLGQMDQELARLEKMANTAPAVEAEFATLNRDYGIIKKNYDELTSRRESARIADAVETRGEKIQFRVVDPPQVPLTPSGPPRLILMSAVLIGAIGAGFAAAFLISQLDDSFISMTRLRRAVAVPVLGSVSRVLSAGERRRRLFGTVSFASSLAALVVVYGYLAAVVLRIKLPIS